MNLYRIQVSIEGWSRGKCRLWLDSWLAKMNDKELKDYIISLMEFDYHNLESSNDKDFFTRFKEFDKLIS